MPARMLSKYGPYLAGAIPPLMKGVAKYEAGRQARRAMRYGARLVGLNGKVSKFTRMKGKRLPLYKKGYERLSGFYGKFKPAFGKELKFFDTIINISDTNHLWKPLHINALNSVGRGTDPDQRIGRNFTTRTIQFKFRIEKIDLISTLTYRIVVVLDRQANGEVPNAAQIWLNPGPTTSAWHSPRNLENIERFEFLWDKTYTLDAMSGGSSGRAVSIADSYYKKIHLKTEMSGTAGPATITDIKDNSITLWACTNTSAANAVTTGTFRIRFTG